MCSPKLHLTTHAIQQHGAVMRITELWFATCPLQTTSFSYSGSYWPMAKWHIRVFNSSLNLEVMYHNNSREICSCLKSTVLRHVHVCIAKTHHIVQLYPKDAPPHSNMYNQKHCQCSIYCSYWIKLSIISLSFDHISSSAILWRGASTFLVVVVLKFVSIVCLLWYKWF